MEKARMSILCSQRFEERYAIVVSRRNAIWSIFSPSYNTVCASIPVDSLAFVQVPRLEIWARRTRFSCCALR